MNCEIKEMHIVFLAIIFLIFVNFFMIDKKNNVEGFAYERKCHKHHRHHRNYKYNDWYDWYYWLYYINPWYPPRQVDLPFEGRDGGISWYEPWTRGVFNY